jgi:HAD superfamily hydrolase (TIGR01509 family)
MENIKVIYFDLGKVLVDFDWTEAVRKMQHRSGCSTETIHEIVTSGPLAVAYESGKVSSEEFFSSLKSVISFHGTANELQQIWSDIFRPIEDHNRIARSLSRHYRLGVISNTNEAHVEHIRIRFDTFRPFSFRVFSFETGCLKPQREIFEAAASKVTAQSHEILFIDDLEKNIQGARELGWQTIHLTRNKVLLEELSQLELRV